MPLPSTPARVYVAASDAAARYLPEGPRAVRLNGDRGVMWVNIQTAADATAGQIWVQSPDRGSSHIPFPGRPGFVFPTDRDGVFLVGADKRVGLLDWNAESFQPLATIPDDDPRTIINDGEIAPGGKAVVFGTKDVRFADPIAHLYLFTPDDRNLSVLADRQTCSNGKAFATDARGLVLYDIDTPTKTVVRYRLDLTARTATPDGVALDLRNEPGFPDGMVDAGEGTVIVAFYNPDPVPTGRAVRYNLATGEPLEEWTTPGAPRVTCPLLDGGKLILTTATEEMSAELFAKCPQSGNLFTADTLLSTAPAAEVVRL
jgi:sugar lactone lactonase YvrE